MYKEKTKKQRFIRAITFVLSFCMLLGSAGAISYAEDTVIPDEPLAAVASGEGVFKTIAAGETLFSDRTHAFSATTPTWLIGKPYLQVPIASTVSVTAKSHGWLYVITQNRKSDSQVTALTSAGFTRIGDLAKDDFCTTLQYDLAIMAKEVQAGETVSYAKWGILVADFAMDSLATVYTPAETGVEKTVAVDGRIFSGKTTHAFCETVPQGLLGQPYLQAAIANGATATVRSAGRIYVLTATEGSSSQLATLKAQGFTPAAYIPAKVVSTTLKEPLALMVKNAAAGETVTFTKWAILFANVTNDASQGEEELNNTATLTVGMGSSDTVDIGKKIFLDRDYTFAQTVPSELIGKGYWCGFLSGGGAATVKAAGWVYVLTPSAGNANSQADTLTSQGFEVVKSYTAKAVSTDLKEPLVLFGKEMSVGETLAFDKWAILIADIDVDPEGTSFKAPTVIQNPTAEEYLDGNRPWQGIPGIAKDPQSGRLWATWYSGGEGEGPHNWVVLYTSTDDGKSWIGPKLVIDHEFPVRAFDPNLWTDPDGRLWLFWTQSYTHDDGVFGAWAMYTSDPESEDPTWSEPIRIANGVAMNDPVVLANGDWILPTAIWAISPEAPGYEAERNSNAYVSRDKGATWSYLGSVPGYEGERNADENMIIEQPDGTLRMLIRTKLGIEESYSSDGGKTWSASIDAHLSPVVSRFYVATLASGNQVLIYNDPPAGSSRTHLTAALSTDGGLTWPHKLIIDERASVTYPDAFQDSDGNIYVIYDHGRKEHGEILMAKITEADIMAGKLVSEGSVLQRMINNNISEAQAKITGTSVLLGSDLSIRYHLTVTDETLLSLGALSMHFTVNGEPIVLTDYQTINGEYVFTLRGLAPQQLRDTIDAAAYAGSTRLCANWDYSIYKNCTTLLQESAEELGLSQARYDAMRELITALLHYGAAAQDYTDYHTDKPILDGTENLSQIDGAPTGSDRLTVSNTEKETVYIKSATVRFETDNRLRVKLFIADDEKQNVKLFVNGTEIALSSLEALGEGIYRFTSGGILATDLSRVYRITLVLDGAEHASLAYSVNAYTLSISEEESATEEMKTLALALYRYGSYAVAYANTL